jgi:hypothetical protein
MVDWSKVPVMTAGPSREEEAAIKKQQEEARSKLGLALTVPGAIEQMAPTSLPETGGLLGGMAMLAVPELRVLAPLMQRAPAVVRPFVPSLIGSSTGTAAGTVAEQMVTGQDILSGPTAQKMFENLITNAAYDVGGNLVFTAAGQTVKVGKDMLEKFGIRKGLFASEEGAARKAAQEWLSSRGATLTKGQLTGDVTSQLTEDVLRTSPGAQAFKLQEQKAQAALKSGTQDVLNSLDTSDAFKMALKQGDPASLAVGDRFQLSLKEAEAAMKDKYRPTFEKISEDMGLRVDLRAIKSEAQKELDKLAGRKFAGAGAERRRALEDILKQDDEVTLGTAHALRSDFLSAARDLKKADAPATALEAEYNNQAQGIRNAMDGVMVVTFGNEEQKALAKKLGFVGGVDSAAGLRSGQYLAHGIDSIEKMSFGFTKANAGNNELLRDYWNAQRGYKNAMEGFYNGTVAAALKAEPSAVGEFLFNIDRPERLRDVNKAVAEAQKYLKPQDSKGIKEELQYGYLSQMFGSAEGISKFASKMKTDENFKRQFNKLFEDSKIRNELESIANAAHYSGEVGSAVTALRNRGLTAAATAGTTIAAAGVGYFIVPNEMKDKLDASALAYLAASGGVFYLTPKIMAKAATSKSAMDTLAMLRKAQDNPKYAGAAALKIVDGIRKEGLFDNEFLATVQSKLAPSQQQAPAQQVPEAQPIDWSQVPVMSE